MEVLLCYHQQQQNPGILTLLTLICNGNFAMFIDVISDGIVKRKSWLMVFSVTFYRYVSVYIIQFILKDLRVMWGFINLF